MEAGQPAPFGTLLRRYRRAAGFTHEELAERAGVSRRSIGDLERGAARAPRRDTVALLAEALSLGPRERTTLAAAAHAGPNAPARLPTIPSEPPFVGRAHELTLLERHLEGDGPPLLVLAGEPGIGKTRLLRAAASRAVGAGYCVLEGGCQRRGGHEPYAPLLGALQRYIRGQSPSRLRHELRGCAWLVRLLPELAEGPIPPLPGWVVPPAQERRLMVQAVQRFLTQIAGPGGVFLVLDALQWADADALEVLATLVRSAHDVSLRLIGAYRDTEVAEEGALGTTLTDLAHARLVTQRLLGPLAAQEAVQLLDEVLGDVAGASSARREHIVQRAGGVPFFVLSCAQSLRLELEGVLDAGEARVPWDVAQSARQRLATLPSEVREVLGVAALVGRVAQPRLLATVTERPEPEVLAALTAAERARLLVADAHTYRFAHDVVREVVEDDVGLVARRVLHRRIADALQAEAGDGPVEEIAFHYARSDEDRAAAEWLERAGDRAVIALAHRAALEHYKAAWQRRVAGGAEVSEGTADALADLAEKMADASASLYQYPAARDHLAQARTRTGSPLRRAVLWYKEGMTFRWEWGFGPALAAFDAAEAEGRTELGRAALPARLRAAIAQGRAEIHRLQGHRTARDAAVEEAIRLFGEGDEDAQPLEEVLRIRGATSDTGALAPLAHALVIRGAGLAERDETERGQEQCRRGLALYEAAGDVRGAAIALWYLAYLAETQGHLAAADEQCRRSLQSFEICGGQYGAVACWQLLSAVACQRGEFAQAEEYAQHGLAATEQMGNEARTASAWQNLGRVALHRGHLPRAEEYFRRQLAIGERLEVPHTIAAAWLDLGTLAYERGELCEAARWCRAARRQAHGLSDTPLEAEAVLCLARVRLLSGRWDAAVMLLEHGLRLAGIRPWSRAAVQAALLDGEIQLRQGAVVEAQAAAEEALRLSGGQGRRLDEAIAHRLLGRIAIANGDATSAEAYLRSALARQRELGANLEAARSRLALAQALVMVAAPAIPAEARTLLSDAQAQFVRSGAALDLAQAQAAAAAWGIGTAPAER